MRTLIRLVVVSVLTSAITACGTSTILQSKVAEPQVYVLKSLDAGTAHVAYSHQLVVALPTATPGLDTDRIAVLRDGNHLDYFYGARWGGTTPDVIQAFVVALLQSQQGFKSVVAEQGRMNADYLLQISIADFQAEYANSSAPTVHVTLIANLINIKERTSSPLLKASAAVVATDNRLNAVVTAFQSALQQTSMSLSEQIISSVK